MSGVTTPRASSPIDGRRASSTAGPPPISGILAFSPASSYCLRNCSVEAPAIIVRTASASRRIFAMYGERSMTPSGAQSFWITWPPFSSNVRWNPPTTSQPNA